MRKTIKRAIRAFAVAALGAALLSPPASAEFGLSNFDGAIFNENGSAARQAGSHPFAVETYFKINQAGSLPEGQLREVFVEAFEGFVGDATAIPHCSTADFLPGIVTCPRQTVVGAAVVQVFADETAPVSFIPSAIYSLAPPPGAVARLGWKVAPGVPVIVDVGVSASPPHRVVASSRYTSNILNVYASAVQLWGVPGSTAHDFARGSCVDGAFNAAGGVLVDGRMHLIPPPSGATCPSGSTPVPFMMLPRNCDGPLETTYRADSWQDPGKWDEGGVLTHDGASPPNPIGFTGCEKLGFAPEIGSEATTDSAGTATGLDFSIDIDDEGLIHENGLADSDINKTVVTLPEGMTVNPSIAEGLQVCTPADLARETLAAKPGEGCPNGSKIGTVKVETPLLGQAVNGSVFIAQQDDPATTQPGAENPFDSMLAFYIVLKSEFLGIIIKQPAKVEPDPRTGQLVTTAEDIPQLPFSRFEFHFREGQRAPLISPPVCGEHQTKSVFTPWARPNETFTSTATFQINRGLGGGPCPPPGTRPFEPGFSAGTANNNAGSYSPFLMRLTRRDGDQDLTRFDATLPPGALAKLAGVTKCPEGAIAQIKAKTGKEELASPSCPPNSRIGSVQGGAGVGSQLTYVPGSVYLAGPFGGAPLSVVGVVPAVAGPFDVGVVATRQALTVDRITGVASVDGALSEPIPHILAGIPLNVRDIQVRVDRPEFTLNPTSCDPMATTSAIWGGGLDVFSSHDDAPVGRSARFQAANCSRLGFKPHLRIDLRGGTRRGANPALRAILRPKPGNANIEKTIVRLPRSAFLDQAHIKTICTRVQWANDSCPKASRYGNVVAHSPLLDQPLRGPAYLRSSNNLLPDLVFDLRGEVNIESGARIDSIRGGIRAIFAGIPDAPLDRVVVNMAGGKRSLIVNSRNLCSARSRANVRMDGHNGAIHKFNPLVRNARCNSNRKGKGKARQSLSSAQSLR